MQKLDEIKNKFQQTQKGSWIKVGMSTCGIAAGADVVMAALKDEARKNNVSVRIEQCGCAGMCFAEPLVEVFVEGVPQVTYGAVKEDTARAIIQKHVMGKEILNDYIYKMQ
ncbi:MAG: (2Fe-2S) ferredoxin domain-containing protein [Candidatus Omnitrophica bacterium]|nr:(2Fe-2S) ferredoxin domain-containing protein [Candidatus Omnitrophota bacterium]